MPRCVQCKVEIGDGGVVQEDGRVLCEHCDTQTNSGSNSVSENQSARRYACAKCGRPFPVEKLRQSSGGRVFCRECMPQFFPPEVFCFFHPQTDAVAECHHCKRTLCGHCKCDTPSGSLCPICNERLYRIAAEANARKKASTEAKRLAKEEAEQERAKKLAAQHSDEVEQTVGEKQVQAAAALRPRNAAADVALALGVASVFVGSFLGIVPLLAIVFGIIGVSKSGVQGRRGCAIAGIVLGGIYMVVNVIAYHAPELLTGRKQTPPTTTPVYVPYRTPQVEQPRPLERCYHCKGTGNGSTVCYGCNGRGSDAGLTCVVCKGRGFTECVWCRGTGLSR
jgi:DNA-directed RNA polymerase subunit RPC12/RpoP